MWNDRSSDMWNARSSHGAERRVVGKPMAIARSASSSGGWGREGVRSEARAQQRLAPGGTQAPITRKPIWRAALPLTRIKHLFLKVRAPVLTIQLAVRCLKRERRAA